MQDNFTIKLCKSKDYYTTKNNIKLNLNKLSKEFKTIVKTPILIIIKINNHEIIAHNHGELIFKDLKDKNKIKKIAKKIYHA